MSSVWEHFIVDGMDSKYAFCNYCKSRKSRGSCKTTSMHKHFIQRDLKLNLYKICQKLFFRQRPPHLRGESHLTNVASTSTFATSEMGRNKMGPKKQKSSMQQTLTQTIDNHTSYCKNVFDGQSLNIVENRGFTELINHLEPRFTMPSRKTLSNDSAVKNVESQLLEADFVTITTDL
ncbi:hypothetical protein PR048_021659 [Dryococelus australis]|uniref:BED-type domain-containing protein n=1 Tax=Dryococelus australis TaxID=614101 RepID=A0ABQ9GYV6_9NEOP|nr:hypothetical protein PR048_021659 [Dryococelus australis]